MKEADMDLEKLGQKFVTQKEDLKTMSFEERVEELNRELAEQKSTTTKKKKVHK
jgi:hypothetical protein